VEQFVALPLFAVQVFPLPSTTEHLLFESLPEPALQCSLLSELPPYEEQVLLVVLPFSTEQLVPCPPP